MSPTRRRRRVLLALMVAACVAVSGSSAPGASSSTVVGAHVPSVTHVDASGCASGVAGSTSFGSTLPGLTQRTDDDCSIVFGSSNDRSTLRMRQADGVGDALVAPTDGSLEPSFGVAGLARHDFSPGPSWDYADTVEVDSSGRILTGGKCIVSGEIMACVMRYLADGSLDPSFNGGSPALFDQANLLSANWNNDSNSFTDIEIDPVGRIIAAGTCNSPGQGHDFCMTRLDTNGVPDPTFGATAGIQVYQPGGTTSFTAQYAQALLLEPSGRIVMGGVCTNTANDQRDPCVVYFDADGRVDHTRGTSAGTTIFPHPLVDPGISRYNEVTDLELTPTGRMLASMRCTTTGPVHAMCVARLRQDGRIDPAFGDVGTPGFARPFITTGGRGTSLTQDVVGRIYVAGNCTVAGAACVARLLADGSLDTTWGTSAGFTLAATGTDYEWPDRIRLVDGHRIDLSSWCSVAGAQSVCITRFHATTGAVDTTFGTSGTVRHGTQLGTVGGGYNAIYGDIAPIEGGYVWGGNCDSKNDTCLLRIADGPTMHDYGTAGATWAGAVSMFGACLEGTTPGTSPVGWTPSAGCPAADGAWWRAVPKVASPVASTDVAATDGTVRFRFGIKIPTNQPAGAYSAPIEFTVVAP